MLPWLPQLRELERVSDGISTQIEFRMINKWRVKIIQRRIYKVKDSFMGGGLKKKKKKREKIVV